MFNAANILEALKNYIHTRGGTSNAYNIAEAVNDLNSIPQGSGGGIPEAPIDNKQYARKNGDWSEVQSSGGDIPDEVTNAVETHGMGWTSEEEVEGFDIQWDGNTEGLDVINDIFYKVSSDMDGIQSKSDLIGATIVTADGSGSVVITDGEVFTYDNKVYSLTADGFVVVALEDGMLDEDVPISKGIWFVEVSEAMYISRLYKEASTEEVVHQIDQKYIPQSSGGGGMVVNLTFVDFDTPITADKTLLELGEAFSNGIPVIARLYVENQLVISAQCVQCADPYETCHMSFGGSVYNSDGDYTYYPIMGGRKLDDDEETRVDFWECPILG